VKANTASLQLQSNFVQLKYLLILAMCMLYLAQFLIATDFLQEILAFLAAVIFFISVQGAKPFPKYFSLFMLITGVTVIFLTGGGMEETVAGVTLNVPILTLLLLVPLITVPLKIGEYLSSVEVYMRRFIHQPERLFSRIVLSVFILGPVLNLGSVQIMHEIFKKFSVKNTVLLAKAYSIGFSTVILWSPYFASVALILYHLGLPVLNYMLFGLPLAMLQLLTGIFLFRLNTSKKNKAEPLSQHAEKLDDCHTSKIKRLLWLLLLLLLAVFILEWITQWPMMFLVSIISIVFPVLWGLAHKKMKETVKLFYEYREGSLSKMDNEIVMFLSTGLFVKSLTGSALSKQLNQLLHSISSFSSLLFIITIVGTTTFLAVLGFHAIIIVLPLVIQLDPVSLGITPEIAALIFMLAWSISAIISPVNPLNLLVSHLLNQSSYTVGLRWNKIFILTMFVVGTIYIYLVNLSFSP
jgi:hypothetical protein